MKRERLVRVGLILFAILTLDYARVFAQAPPPPEGPRPPLDRPEGLGPQGPPPPEMGAEMRERWRLKGMRGGMGELPPGLRMDGQILSPFEGNAVDQARFQIAALLLEQKKYEDAIGELLKTAEESPDPTASAAAHISVGNIFRQCLKETEKAIEQYREVKGRLAELATKSIVDTYQEAGKPEEAVKALEDILAATKEPGQKVRLLNMMADVYRRSGKPDKAVETLRKITESLSYDDAEAMRRGWMDEEAQLDKIEANIHDLRAAGRNEEADRLQKEAEEIKARKQMREALKNQKRAEPAPAKTEAEPKKEAK